MAESLLELPLFPLDVVLFPGMALPLHIFEPRYRRMTGDCLDSDQQFGIVLALPGSTEGHEIPAMVGTMARIVDYQRLSDGRYNLLTLGTRRFEALHLDRSGPYLKAIARVIEDEPDSRGISLLASEARHALIEYLRLILQLVGSDECEISIPSDPIELSFAIPPCLACDDEEKQEMLAMRTTAARLRHGTKLLRAELSALAREFTPQRKMRHTDERAQLN